MSQAKSQEPFAKVFRVAVVRSASVVVLMHNQPSVALKKAKLKNVDYWNTSKKYSVCNVLNNHKLDLNRKPSRLL
jgi:hypothetical protein